TAVPNEKRRVGVDSRVCGPGKESRPQKIEFNSRDPHLTIFVSEYTLTSFIGAKCKHENENQTFGQDVERRPPRRHYQGGPPGLRRKGVRRHQDSQTGRSGRRLRGAIVQALPEQGSALLGDAGLLLHRAAFGNDRAAPGAGTLRLNSRVSG